MEEGLWQIISTDGPIALIPTCTFKGKDSSDQWDVMEVVPIPAKA